MPRTSPASGSARPLHAGLRAIVLAVLTLVLAASPAAGYMGDSYDPTRTDGRYWPKGAELQYAYLDNRTPPSWMRALINQQMDRLNTDARRANTPTFTLTTNESGAELRIGYGIPGNTLGCGSSTSLGCARDQGGWFALLLAKDVLDGGGHYRWCQYPGTSRSEGCFDVRNVILHEVGHVYGLEHWSDVEPDYGPGASITVMQTASRDKPMAGWDRVTFGGCDAAALQLDYGIGAYTNRYSTCLVRQGIDLRLQVSDTSIPYRGTVKFTATLTVETDKEVFDGNPVTDRTVLLERWKDGSVTGTFTMTPDTYGTYTVTLGPSETANYRAVFAQPDDEGLKGGTSGYHGVTVAPCSTPPCPTVAVP